MSLISDALKKARQEAARQDSLRPGLPYAVGAVEARPARAPWISLLAGLGAGCLLAAVIFAMAFFGGWGPFHKPVAQTQVAVSPAVPAPAAPAPQPVVAAPSQPAVQEPPAKPVAVVETPAPKPAPAPEPPKREPETVRPAPPPQTPPAVAIAPHPAPETAPAPQSAAEAPAPASAPVQAAPAPATPPQSAPEGGLVEGNTYTGELPVPGGGSVKLNGIVYSPDHPIAVLDGRVMGPGENVQGFTVVAIESGRVKLQGHGATVYLSPK
jgi:hypothetical protein